ncbi:DUF485 domain-containing protein [Sulfurimonas sp. SAG-AH-194-I05]|nr:DUF485 domain-containing protein [Sulfurimonas sp. SAG-AH-194-I05]MDF1875824.1 DUF485 domain-containing protein [Sulfurimonas sp. SAG-AH-194-I05]
MKNEYIKTIKNDPNYKELLQRRRRLTLGLSLSMLVVYFSFILSIAFKPSLLGTPIFSDSVITYGIAVGIFVILFAFILTGIYTYIANKKFDALTQKIQNNVKGM